jgi:S1-C subfamily serine protease
MASWDFRSGQNVRVVVGLHAGAEVASVTSGSAADKAGLQAGDVVTGRPAGP